MKKALFIRLSSLGDVLLVTAAARCLHKQFPWCNIDIVTKAEYAPLLDGLPYFHRIIGFDTRTTSLWSMYKQLSDEYYDLTLDAHNNLRSKILSTGTSKTLLVTPKYTARRFFLVHTKINLLREALPLALRHVETLKPFGVSYDGEGIDVATNEKNITEEVRKFVNGSHGKIIGIAPGARHATKRWPAARYAEAAKLLGEQYDARIIIFGDRNDRETARVIEHELPQEKVLNLAGKTSLAEVVAAMNKCDAVISNDSGLMHVAEALKKPLIAIFGSTVKEFGFMPVNSNSVVAQADVSCRPCSHIGRDDCPRGHFHCMMNIDVKQVLDGVKQVVV